MTWWRSGSAFDLMVGDCGFEPRPRLLVLLDGGPPMSRSVWIKCHVVTGLCFLCEGGDDTGVWARFGADCGPEGRVLERGSPWNRRPIGKRKWFWSLYKRRTLHPPHNTVFTGFLATSVHLFQLTHTHTHAPHTHTHTHTHTHIHRDRCCLIDFVWNRKIAI